MAFGSSSFGSSAFGSSQGSTEQVFFPLTLYSAGSYEARVEFTGDATAYSIFAVINSDAIEVNFEVFTSNDPGETPQSQGSFGGFGNYFQYVVGAAKFITLNAVVGSPDQVFRAVGRPGT